MADPENSHNHRDCKECHAPVPAELKPYFDIIFIYSTCICAGGCHAKVLFESQHPEGCYGRMRDEALAARDSGWVVSSTGAMHCPNCAARLRRPLGGPAGQRFRFLVATTLAGLIYWFGMKHYLR